EGGPIGASQLSGYGMPDRRRLVMSAGKRSVDAVLIRSFRCEGNGSVAILRKAPVNSVGDHEPSRQHGPGRLELRKVEPGGRRTAAPATIPLDRPPACGQNLPRERRNATSL